MKRSSLLGLAVCMVACGCNPQQPAKSPAPAPIPAVLKSGPLDQAKAELEKNPNLAKAKDISDNTALHYATYTGQFELVQLLLSKGADPDARNKNGQNALHRAVNSTNEAMIKLLLDEKMDPNNADNFGRTPLMNAIIAGNTRVTKLLLENGGQPAKALPDGTTSFHLAAGCATDILTLLMQAKPAIDHANGAGYTMLHQAADAGRVENVKLLHEAKASLTATNKAGLTPVMLVEQIQGEARTPGHDDVEDYLRKVSGMPPRLSAKGSKAAASK